MKLFELVNPYHNQLLNPQQEPDDQNKPPQPTQPGEDEDGKFDADQVDHDLQDMAQGVDDENAQPELPGGAQYEPPELDDQNVKPLDDSLIQQAKNLPFNTNWKVPDRSPIAPMKILAMPIEELSSLRNMVDWQIQNETMKSRVGTSKSDNMQWYTDLIKFLDTVMNFKKTNTQAQLAKINPTPAYQTQQKSGMGA